MYQEDEREPTLKPYLTAALSFGTGTLSAVRQWAEDYDEVYDEELERFAFDLTVKLIDKSLAEQVNLFEVPRKFLGRDKT